MTGFDTHSERSSESSEDKGHSLQGLVPVLSSRHPLRAVRLVQIAPDALVFGEAHILSKRRVEHRAFLASFPIVPEV